MKTIKKESQQILTLKQLEIMKKESTWLSKYLQMNSLSTD